MENSTVNSSFDGNDDIQPEFPLELTVEILFMAISGCLGASFGITGLFVVKKNSILIGIIEHYAFIDLSNYIIINTCHLIWAIPSALWHVNEAVPWLDNIISGFAFTAISIGFPPKLLLGINRFCALSFEGRFYRLFERTKPFQYLILIGYPLMTAIAFSIPGCHCVYVGGYENYFFVQRGECGEMVMYYTQVVPCYTIVPMQSFFDVAVFYLMRKRLRSLQKSKATTQSDHQQARQLRREMKLVVQMVSNAVSGLIMTTSILATTTMADLITSPFLIFILNTALWLISNLIPPVCYVVLFREQKSSRRETITNVPLSDTASKKPVIGWKRAAGVITATS